MMQSADVRDFDDRAAARSLFRPGHRRILRSLGLPERGGGGKGRRSGPNDFDRAVERRPHFEMQDVESTVGWPETNDTLRRSKKFGARRS
jgi:hypothetical protein